jgi:biotin transport system substrate-specific component
MSKDESLISLHRLVWTAMLAALTAVGAYVTVPLGPVPVTLQTFFVILSGYVLGPAGGAAAVGLYLAAGSVGLPVFAGGKSGAAVLLGPTGGYLVGFAACAAITGMTGRKAGWLGILAYGLAGLAAIYVLGVARLKFVLDAEWTKAAAIGLLPFLPGAAVKLLLAAGAYRFMLKRRLLPD